MAESELHMEDMIDTIQVLRDHFADKPDVYVWGNLLLYYEEGNPRKHVSPDVLLAFVPKEPKRDNYLVWKEGRAPDFVVEITSKSTKTVDQKKKYEIYRDVLRVSEYFLFDPRADYLDPPLQGYRLVDGDYVRIDPIAGRLPSQVLGLHLERDGAKLRLIDPATATRCRPGVNEPRLLIAAPRRNAAVRRRNAAAQRRNAAALRLRKPLSTVSPRRTSVSAGRSRPSEADDACSQRTSVGRIPLARTK